MEPEIWYSYPRLGLKRGSSGESIGWPRFWQDPPEIMVSRPPFSGPTIQTLIEAKGVSDLVNFHLIQGCVNITWDTVCLTVITTEERGVWRVDGLAAISAGFPSNHGTSAAIFPGPPSKP